MNISRHAGYYRQREQIELERAEKAKHSSARRAHLGLAALYRREFELASAEEKAAGDAPSDETTELMSIVRSRQ
jgi:hypothetical protein